MRERKEGTKAKHRNRGGDRNRGNPLTDKGNPCAAGGDGVEGLGYP